MERRHPIVAVDTETAQSIIRASLPGRRVVGMDVLAGGFCNTSYKLTLDGPPDTVVLRVMTHEPARWAIQVELMRRVVARVAVPQVLDAGRHERMEFPFAVLSWVDGAPLRRLTSRVGESVGRQLAAIGTFRFESPGFLGPGLEVEPFPPDAFWSFFHRTVHEGRAGIRLGPELSHRLTAFVTSNLHYIDALADERVLVHSDFNPKNILVRGDEVVAVLDWDFAFVGSPLTDVGNLFRYIDPSGPFAGGFVSAYRREGGQLPPWWRRGARLLDLLAHCDFLDAEVERPERFAESRHLIRRTLDEWDALPE